MGTDGVYTLTSSYERDAACPVCSAGVPLDVSPAASLRDVLAALAAHATLGPLLGAPSLSFGARNLYMRGALEAETAGNLEKRIGDLVDGDGSVLTVNDRKLVAPLKVCAPGVVVVVWWWVGGAGRERGAGWERGRERRWAGEQEASLPPSALQGSEECSE